MKTLELIAIDTLFFRDGKPFSMGEETWANGIFPPFPSALQGTLRSIWFADNLPDLARANTAEDPTANLDIQGYLPALNGAAHFPIPQDLYAKKREDNNKAYLLKCHELPKDDSFLSDYPFDCILQTAETTKVEELGGKALLDQAGFLQYLKSEANTYGYEKMSDYVLDEPKIGIGREFETRTASEGRLYRVAMRRPTGKSGTFSFLLKYNGITLPANGISRMGAETKAVEYKERSEAFLSIAPLIKEGDRYFKIYLATPAIFEEGIYPATWFAAKGLKLLTAAVGRVQNVGGFDYKTTQPKPMQKAVPAGTVYYVEVVDLAKAAGVVGQLHEGSIYNLAPNTDTYKLNYQSQGFGLTYLGTFHLQKA